MISISKLIKKFSPFVKKNSNISLVFVNFSWIFSGKIFYAVSSLVINIIITRYLGPKDNGVFNYVLAYTTPFSAIAGMGLEEVIEKEFNVEKEKSGSILFSGFILKLCGGIAACVFSVFFALLVGMTSDKIVYVMIISLSFVFQASDVFLYWFQSQSCNKIIVLCQNCIRALFVVIKLFIALFGGTLLEFVVVTSLETIVLSTAVPIVYKKNSVKANNLSFNILVLKKLFRLSCPMILSSVAASIYMKVDQVMIGQMLGDCKLGIYSVAVRLAESWYFIPMGISTAVLPFLTKASLESEEKMYSLLQAYSDGMTILAYGISVGITFFSQFIIRVLFGNEYIEADKLLILYVWSGIFVNFGLIRGSYISIKECTSINMYGTFLGAFANILLNFVLIPTIGEMGAVWATFLSQMLAAFISSFLFKKTRRLAFIQLNSLFPFVRAFSIIKKL